MVSSLRSLARKSSALLRTSSPPYATLLSQFPRFQTIASPGCVNGRRLYSLRRTCPSDVTPITLAFTRFRSISTDNPNLIRRRYVVSRHHVIQRRWYSEHRKQAEKSFASIWAQLDLRAKLVVIAIIIGLLFAATHLERVPQTGRWRFIAFSEEMEIKLQDDQYKALLEEYRDKILPSDHPVTQQVRDVVTAILDANGLGVLASASPAIAGQKGTQQQNIDVEIWDPDAYRSEFDTKSDQTSLDSSRNGKLRKWNLMVVQDDGVVNAMVVNGNIVVFTGILPIAFDIDGLAAVLSHEIAHVVARHLAEKLSSQTLVQFIFYALEFLGFDLGLGPTVVKFLYQLPNSRTMELEADKIGLELAAKACFDPRGAVSMQTRLAQLEARHTRGINLDFLQTHPAGRTRVKQLSDALPEAYALRAGSSACAHLEDDFDAFRAMADSVRSEQENESPE